MNHKLKQLLICFLVIYSVPKAYSQCPLMYPLFTELTFYQDSINPLTIHTTFKAVARLDCDFTQEETSVNWGDGTGGLIYIADTVSCIEYNPLQVYYATHTYDTLLSDSIVYFSFSAWPIPTSVTNTFGSVGNDILGTQGTINFKYLKNTVGFHSPVFNGPYFIYDTMFHVLTYDPLVFVDTPYHVHVGIVQPYSFLNEQNVDIYPINYPSNPSNNYSVDINTGTLLWDTAQGWGGYLFTYLVYTYDTAGNFICANSRDMIINVADTLSQSTGIENIDESGINLYPNPTNGILTIDLSNMTATLESLSVYDLIGDVLYTANPEALSSKLVQINMSDYSGGLYIISVKDNAGCISAKVVVSK